MDQAPEHERELVEYLLGRLPALERVQLEERLFEDADLDEQLVATTDDLIHAYLRGELAPEDRRQFETHFLAAADHRERLRFMTRLLATLGASARRRSSRRGRFWLAAASALIALGTIFVFMRDRDTVERRLATSPSPAPEPVLPVGSRPRPSPAHGGDVTLVRVSRGDAPVIVRVSEQTRLVRLQVKVDDASPSFDATIHAAGGAEIWRADAMAPPLGELLALEVPARLLQAQAEYSLRIVGESLREGAPPVLEYRLRVERQAARPAAH